MPNVLAKSKLRFAILSAFDVVNGSCQGLFIVCRGFFDVQLSFDAVKSSLLEHCDENIFKLFGTLATLNESFCSDAVSLNKSPHTVLRLDFRLKFFVSQKNNDSLVSKRIGKKSKSISRMTFFYLVDEFPGSN